MKKLELYRNFLKSKRPIDEISFKKIEENLKAKYIYNSNGIEGNTLSLMETNLILEHGVTIKGKSLKEHLEVKGQEYALNFLTEVMNQKEEISLRMIREFNSLVMINGGGTFKTLPNEIIGANFKTSPPHLVEEHLSKLIENFYSSNEDIIKKVAIFHADFEKIHPFPDGNGRTGRLLMNLELMKEGFPITIIKKEDREDYYNALEKAHSNYDYEDIISFIENNVEKSFEFYFENITNNWKQEIEDFYFLNNKLDEFIDKNYIKICNNLGKEIVDIFEKRFPLDSVFQEISKKSINNSDEEIIKEAQNIFERDVLNIKFETEEEFLEVFYEEAKKDLEEKIDNYDNQNVEDIFYEKIGFVKKDLMLELIENKTLNFEEKYQEYQKSFTIEKKEETKSIEEKKKKDYFEY
jgi:FIC domain-containing protein